MECTHYRKIIHYTMNQEFEFPCYILNGSLNHLWPVTYWKCKLKELSSWGQECINSSRKYGLYIYTQITHICTIPHPMSTWTCSFRTVVLIRTIFILQSISVSYPGSLTILHVAHQLCLLLTNCDENTSINVYASKNKLKMATGHKAHKHRRRIVCCPLLAMFSVKILTVLFIVEQ